MCPDFEVQQDEAGTAGALKLLALLGCATVVGTIDARIEVAERRYYPEASEMLIRGAPVTPKQPPTPAGEPLRPQPRAKDLIAEINSINSQIHEIMFQVEKAVARLTSSG